MPTTLTLLQVAHVLNLAGGTLLVLLSWGFARRYPTPFFNAWLAGFGLYFGLTAGQLLAEFWGRSLPITLLQTACVGGASWFFWTTARLLKGAQPPSWRGGSTLAAIAGASLAAEVAGVPFQIAGVPIVLAATLALVRIGLVFLRELPAESQVPGAVWVGWAAILLGLWPFICPYPLLVNTPYAIVGFAGAGLLQFAVSMGMMIYLADLNWARYKQAQEQIAQVKNDFVSIVSHELRSPLTTVVGYAEFLEEEIAGPLNAGQREYVTEIQQGGRRLRRLVDDLLDFSLSEGKALKLSCQQADLAAKVRAAVESMRPQALAARVTLTAEIADGPLPMWLDADRIEQVVLNLVGNAIKFTPTEGRVSVHLASDAQGAVLEVCDTGIGVDPADLPHLFEMFYQAGGSRRVRGGAGLGLAITKVIIESHGGTITVASEAGTGTCFVARLPRRMPETPPATDDAAPGTLAET
jgi:signal transduction histidine kinase